MKIFLTLLCAVVMGVSALDKEEAKELLRGMSEDCKMKENASDADLETVLDEKEPATKEGKCFLACMQGLELEIHWNCSIKFSYFPNRAIWNIFAK